MIPANGEYFAAYVRQDGKQAPALEVIAWHDNGDAMVVGKTGLVPAQSLDGFERVYRSEHNSRVVAAVPGGGWRVDWKSEGDDGLATSPVLFWTVQADGTATPVDVDIYGETGSALAADKCYVYHPDHDDPEVRKQAGFGAV